MGGLPTHWRTLTGDAQTNSAWSNAFRSFHVVSPWSVGGYGNITEVDDFRVNQIVPDLADCTSHGIWAATGICAWLIRPVKCCGAKSPSRAPFRSRHPDLGVWPNHQMLNPEISL